MNGNFWIYRLCVWCNKNFLLRRYLAFYFLSSRFVFSQWQFMIFCRLWSAGLIVSPASVHPYHRTRQCYIFLTFVYPEIFRKTYSVVLSFSSRALVFVSVASTSSSSFVQFSLHFCLPFLLLGFHNWWKQFNDRFVWCSRLHLHPLSRCSDYLTIKLVFPFISVDICTFLIGRALQFPTAHLMTLGWPKEINYFECWVEVNLILEVLFVALLRLCLLCSSNLLNIIQSPKSYQLELSCFHFLRAVSWQICFQSRHLCFQRQSRKN